MSRKTNKPKLQLASRQASRKAPNEAAEDDFIGGPKSTPMRQATKGQRVHLQLPPDLVREARIRCGEDRRSLSDLVTEAVARYLKR